MPTASEASPFKSPFARVNTPSKPARSASTPASSVRPKKDWDSYLTDAEQYKLPKEVQLRKKQERISKNNILASPVELDAGVARTPGSFATPRRPTPSRRQSEQSIQISVGSDGSNAETDVEPNSLDLVESTPTKTPLRDVTNFAPSASRNVQSAKPKKVKKKTKSASAGDRPSSAATSDLDQQEIDELNVMLHSLSSELTLFEQLTGGKSVLEDEDLKASLSLDHKSLPSALKATLKLLCQVVSHLLKSEVNRLATEEKHADLQRQIDALKELCVSSHRSDTVAPRSPSTSVSRSSSPVRHVEKADAPTPLRRSGESLPLREQPSPMRRSLEWYATPTTNSSTTATAAKPSTFVAASSVEPPISTDAPTPTLYGRPLRKTSTSDWLFETAFSQPASSVTSAATPAFAQIATDNTPAEWKTPDYVAQDMTTKAVLQRLTQQAQQQPLSPPRQTVPMPSPRPSIPCTVPVPDTNIMRHLMRQTEPATPPRQHPAHAPSSAAAPTVHIRQTAPHPDFEQLEDNTFSALPEHLLPAPAQRPVHPFQQHHHQQHQGSADGVAVPQQQLQQPHRVTGRKLDADAGADLEHANLPEPWKSWVLAK